MAHIVERPRKDGAVTFQVKWRKGGGRNSPGQSEKFADRPSAEEFKALVDAHGQRWPRGWVPGHGFVEEKTGPNDVPWLDWCHRYVDRLTGIEERTRRDYKREVDLHLSLMAHTRMDGTVYPATIGNLTADDVQDWVRAEEAGLRDPDNPEKWLRRPAASKSIQNRHGVMWCIVEAGVKAGLRTENCCNGTRLPRVDDGTQEEMVFLETEEYARFRAEITNARAGDLVDWLIGTGMRWGEATAVQAKDINLTQGTVSVQRAWKRDGANRLYLGAPKTKKARRVVALTPALVALARRLMAGKRPDDLLFQTSRGNVWSNGTFYNRFWKPALEAANAKGMAKRPRIHDLRHTHVAWLIAKRIPLPAIQARLGHESIQTTVDRYGHLVRELDDQIIAALEAVMGAPAVPGLRAVSDAV